MSYKWISRNTTIYNLWERSSSIRPLPCMFLSVKCPGPLVLFFVLVYGCKDEPSHGHGHPRRLPPSTKVVPPTRPLEWGDVNFIHTTDTHGWLLGHQKKSFPEPNYRCDITFLLAITFRLMLLKVVISESLPPLYPI